MFRFFAFALALAVLTPQIGAAQTNQRTSFNDGLAQFNELIFAGKLGDAIAFVRPDVEMTDDEKEALNTQLQGLYPRDFVDTGTVRSETLKGGFRQEMFGYWTEEGEYFYIYLLMHTRDNQRYVLNLTYSTDFEKLYSRF